MVRGLVCGLLMACLVLANGLATSASHSVMVKGDGSVWAWGSNHKGQLGAGETEASYEPVRVEGLSGVTAVAAGARFTIALKGDGTVWAWGENSYGQLGRPEPAQSGKPLIVEGVKDVKAIAAAGSHAMALDTEGGVWVWGEVVNRSPNKRPLRMEGLPRAVAIAISDKHNVALTATGEVWVWGDHGAGDLGDNSIHYSGVPRKVPGLADVVVVGAAYQVTFAIHRDGTVSAIGYGAAGQLGNGAKEDYSKGPVRVVGLINVLSVAGGYMHVLALKRDGTVWAWGTNRRGELGNPAARDEYISKPVRVEGLNNVQAIAAASYHSMAIRSTGSGVWGWGDNEAGSLGADPEDLKRSDVPFALGTALPPPCRSLFACQTERGKVIEVCGTQQEGDIDKWSAIHYRYGPAYGVPELMYPADPENAKPALFFSHESVGEDYRVSVRFKNGGYTYRVFSGSESGAGVEVMGPTGKLVSTVACGERPELYAEYLRMNLPCDMSNKHGANGCKKAAPRRR